MPRNRRSVDREEKRDEIVGAAAALFADVGYEATSMTKVATAAGVTTTTIYWYFTDKDALLVAVLDRLLGEALAEAAEQANQPWEDQVLWAVAQLQHYDRLVTVVHARTGISSAVETWHDGFHQLVDSMMAEGFRDAGVAEPDLEAMTKIGAFVVEGLLTHVHSAQEQRAIIQLLTRRTP
ncbi:MAG: TetR/AcrR family transcriptional regulator [Nocardioidaceae bacterium]|nr:TetR/AcrR family transcriptional regulator [Nocardioidaceae bacterium]